LNADWSRKERLRTSRAPAGAVDEGAKGTESRGDLFTFGGRHLDMLIAVKRTGESMDRLIEFVAIAECPGVA
jgi:hypothetical protein